MERKIGEIFEYNGEWYQCVGGTCRNCSFYYDTVCKNFITIGSTIIGNCDCTLRTDHKCVIFNKLEKVGEPYKLGEILIQQYQGIAPVVLPEDSECSSIFRVISSINVIEIELKQNTEDMEVNEKTMPVPDGWELDRIDESGNIVLKEKKKELPKTWLGCLKCVNDLELIEDGCCIEKWNFARQDDNGYIHNEQDHNLLPLGLGKPMLALCQLLVCRNAWWKRLGWKPDWDDGNNKFTIIYSCGTVCCDCNKRCSRILAFPTSEVRDQFFDTFRDLIEEAKELL